YINIRGVKDVGIVSTILALLVVIAFAMVAICGFMNWNQNPFMPFTADGTIMGISGILPSDWVYYIGMGIAIGLWMYAGYESMSTIAGEVENPQVIPKATLIAIPLIMAVYIFPTMAGLASLGDWQNWGTEPGTIGYADVITTYWGPAFGIFFALVAVLAQCSIYNTYIASGSRGFFALADDYLAPPILVKCDKKYGVPYVAVLSVGIVNLILCNFAFSVVVVIDVFLLTASYVMVFLSAIVLRKKIEKEDVKFKIPGGFGFLCFIAIMPCCIAFCAFFLSGTDYFIGGMLGILTGPILYIIWKKRYGGLAKKDALEYPINAKTGLAVGDLKRMSLMFSILAIMGAIGTQFLPWFEGAEGNATYFEIYKIQGMFDMMMTGIYIATAVILVISIILAVVGNKIEPKKILSKQIK
ncbi:MAG: APC family permease, partial [Anaerovorax sp.]